MPALRPVAMGPISKSTSACSDFQLDLKRTLLNHTILNIVYLQREEWCRQCSRQKDASLRQPRFRRRRCHPCRGDIQQFAKQATSHHHQWLSRSDEGETLRHDSAATYQGVAPSFCYFSYCCYYLLFCPQVRPPLLLPPNHRTCAFCHRLLKQI